MIGRKRHSHRHNVASIGVGIIAAGAFMLAGGAPLANEDFSFRTVSGAVRCHVQNLPGRLLGNPGSL